MVENEGFRHPRPGDDQVLEQAGAVVKVVGQVEAYYHGGAVVQFPATGGGAIGVATALKGLKLGEPVTLEANVVEATRDVLAIVFVGQGADGQTARLERSRCTFA